MAASDLTSSKGQTQYLSSGGGESKPTTDLLLGQTLGSYKILSLLGEGGMGRVYVAEHQVIGRRAAIKVLAAEIATQEELVSRFFTEARGVNDIRHPNIVEVTDFGMFGQQPYIVMELLDGETLEQRLTTVGRLDETATIRIGAQVASAVGAGHEHGMVHRDLKPANIFLRNHPDYPDFVKVLDFGIAKLVASDRKVSHHTQVGSLIGTPAYMSPEQCLGDTHLDHRSDVYSLGIVLFQMVTGQLPFLAETAGRLILCHVQDQPPSPQTLRPDLSSGLATCILRALEKKPEKRFASMRAFREALLSHASTHTQNSQHGVSPNMPTGALAQLLTPPPILLEHNTRPNSVTPLAPPVQIPNASRTVLASVPLAPTAPAPSSTDRPVVASHRPPLFTPTPVLLTPPSSGVNAMRSGQQNSVAPRTPVPTPGTVTANPITNPPSRPGPAEPSSALGTGKSELIDRVVEIARARIVSDLEFSLPPLPRSILRCLDLLSSPDFSFGGMATLLSGDIRLSGQIIQAANTWGSVRSQARNAEQAIARMGAEGTRTTLYEIAVRPILETNLPRLLAVSKQPLQHALAVAILTQRLVHMGGGTEAVLIEAYRAGIYHDAGRPLVATLLLDIERQLAEVKGKRVFGEDMFAVLLDRTHAPASARLARSYGLSKEIADCIEAQGFPPTRGWNLKTALHLANALAHLGGFHTRRDELDKAREAVDDARRVAGIDEKTCLRVLEGLKDAVNRRL
jgi:serine/threonine protein kinase/HD superfamily phosphohydrolase YqeK